MTTTDPKLIERAMTVWLDAVDAYQDNPPTRYDHGIPNKAAAAVIAAAINEAAHQWQDNIDELRDMLADAYAAGATDTHNWWAAGNTESEANFGEAASDYAASVIVRLPAIEAHKESPHG